MGEPYTARAPRGKNRHGSWRRLVCQTVATPTKIRPGTALARLFETAIRTGDAVSFCLPGGVPLFMAGEAADQLFMLRTGRLAALRRDEGQEPRFLGLIRPGEPAGEMSMIAGAPHSADVIAVRDCEILALPRAAFFRPSRPIRR